VDQFTEIKDMHIGTDPYNRTEVKDASRGAAAVNMFQNKLRGI
jgi:hypothetical protein